MEAMDCQRLWSKNLKRQKQYRNVANYSNYMPLLGVPVLLQQEQIVTSEKSAMIYIH